MFIEKLTDSDMALIKEFRKIGMESCTDFYSNNHFCDNKDFLKRWEVAKSSGELLPKIFKDQLIIKKRVETCLEDDQLREDMGMLKRSALGLRLKHKILVMLEEHNDLTAILKEGTTIETEINRHLFCLTSLINNKYNGCTMELIVPNSKNPFKLVRGCKAMKAIGQLAHKAGVGADFEDFRIKQSQIMNEAHLSANLCLSIHPLDYMTASFNVNGWHSCMNWREGEYRRGVVEMMNSPFVVTAYLESNHDKMEFYVYDNKIDKLRDLEWNSKKWREFFIVSNLGIFGIKGYPYWNRQLEDITLLWIKELLGDMGKDRFSDKIISWNVEDGKNNFTDDTVNTKITLDMDCGPAMYNDFYNGQDFHAIAGKDLIDIEKYTFWYSGDASCLVCGEIVDSLEDEPHLLGCEDCNNFHTCESCGEHIYNYNDLYDFNGRTYCYSCYHNLPVCDCCGERLDLTEEPDSGMEFCIGNDIHHYILKTHSLYGSYPIIRYACADCAEDIFKDGTKELSCHHSRYVSWAHSADIIPIDKIKNLEVLNIDKLDIEIYKETCEKFLNNDPALEELLRKEPVTIIYD